MARPRNPYQSVPITRRIHPAYAERLAELEALGYSLEEMIAVTSAVVMTLACTDPDMGDRPKYDYATGRIDQAAFCADQPAAVREAWIRDWEIRQRTGQPLTPIYAERKGWIEAHIARHRARMAELRLQPPDMKEE